MDQQILSKTCTKCGTEKPLNEFTKDKQKRDGMTAHCKICGKPAIKRSTKKRAQQMRDYGAKWYLENKARKHAVAAIWVKANPHKPAEYTEKWRSGHAEQAKAGLVKYRAENSAKINEYARQRRINNPEKVKAADAKWAKANPEMRLIKNHKRRAKKLEVGGTLSRGLSIKLFELQQGKCPCCKQPLGDKYHLDHIIPLALGGGNTDGNMQLLRAKCNLQKSAKHPIDFMQGRGFLL